MKKEKIKPVPRLTSGTRLLNLEVPHESVLLLDLSHPVAELGADGPDGGVQLLHARSVSLVLSCRKLLLYIIFLFTAIYVSHLQSFLQHFGRLRYPCWLSVLTGLLQMSDKEQTFCLE